MATTVNATLKHKRGTEASMPILKDGQIYLCSDTQKVYKGTSTGENILISDIASLNANAQKIEEINMRTYSKVLWEGEAIGTETITLNDNLNNYNKLIFIINKPGEFNFNSEYVDLNYPSNLVGDNVKAIVVPNNYIVMEFKFTTINIRSGLGELHLAKIIGVKDGVINYEN